MSIESVRQELNELRQSRGKAVLNALFPDDFELYMFAVELVNSSRNTENYFVFPVNPNSVQDTSNTIATVTQTFGGVVVQDTDLFVPTDITINGNFGRSLKFLLDQDVISFKALNFIADANNNVFSDRIKTGYGCLKTLERIINKAATLDSFGKPYSLYFYNLALNNSYQVKAMSFVPSMNQSHNMIWEYSLTMKSLLPTTRAQFFNENSSFNLFATGQIQQSGQVLLNSLKSLLR